MTVLRVADVDGTWTAVRLITELWKREPPRALARRGDGWEIELGELPIDRLEYLLEVERADGSIEVVTAPGAPAVGQPFGAKSVLVLDGYRAPAWLGSTAPAGITTPLSIASSTLGGAVEGLLWSAPGLAPDEAAPLVVALDGPEYARYAALDQFLASAVASKALPPLRAALLAPRARNDDYSASDVFAAALAREIVPAVEASAPVGSHLRIGLGASLGGLAILHAHVRTPGLFGAAILQSGSFFDETLDAQERSHRWFHRITAFVREVGTTASSPIPVAITCGTGEENLANNRLMARALAARGYRVAVHERRDCHTWVCWRDSFDVAFASIVSASPVTAAS